MTEERWLPLDQCEDRGVYKLWARNLRVGVYNAKRKGFIGIRNKWGERFLDMEFHWDHDYYPTAKPLEKIGMLPEGIEVDEGSSELREYLEKITKEEGK